MISSADLLQNNLTEIFKPNLIGQQLEGLGTTQVQALISKLIEDLGITTKLTYDGDKFAINFDNLSREFRDIIPVRPLYVLEENKSTEAELKCKIYLMKATKEMEELGNLSLL